jgi:hypothetical protein
MGKTHDKLCCPEWACRAVETLCVAVVCLTAYPAPAAEPPAVRPALTPDKSLLARIAALGENETLLLPKPGVVGEFNEVCRRRHLDERGPRCRDYSLKTVWAPDRRRALYCGGAYGQPINDVWEYDLGSNTWVLLYPPDPGPREAWKTAVFKDGMYRSPRGGPIHVTHTWWGVTYDPQRRILLWMNPGHRLAGTVNAHEADKTKLYRGPYLWGFLPYERKWELQQVPVAKLPRGLKAHCAGILEYIPEWKRSMWQGRFLYDAKAKTWERSQITFSGKGAGPPGESVACYDSTRKVLVVHRGEPWVYRVRNRRKTKHKGYKGTWHLDVEKKEWGRVLFVSADDDSLPFAHDRHTSMSFDSVSGTCLLYHFPSRALWSYDAGARRWAKLAPKGDEAPKHYFKGDPSYFDPLRNVFVIVNTNGVWVYRHRRADAGPQL